MSTLACPKCGGNDYFLSLRNIVKGRGVYQSAKMRKVPVCRVCDEIMTGPDKMSGSESKKFYTPHAALFLATLILSLIPVAQVAVIGVLLLYANVIVLVIRLLVRKSRSI